jgi:hypothetical protein
MHKSKPNAGIRNGKKGRSPAMMRVTAFARDGRTSGFQTDR